MLKTSAVLAGGALLAAILALPQTAVAQPGGAQPGGARGVPGGPPPGGARGAPGGRGGGFGGFGGRGAAATGIPDENNPFTTTVVFDFEQPWALEFLPGGERMLVTERTGQLKLLSLETGTVGEITGVPEVSYGGQGGLGDIVLHPNYTQNNMVYLSYAEEDTQNDIRGAVVALAKLTLDNSGGGKLEDLKVIWRQEPKMRGSGHFSHRIAPGPDGFLYLSSGDRQGPIDETNGAQRFDTNLGRVIRLTLDGEVPPDNPWADRGGVAAQAWSMGHRNLLGLTFDRNGQLWDVEMGPQGGDEINRVVKGENYGWPFVSQGVNYGGGHIPDHETRPEFKAPAIAWVPSISPGDLIFYYGSDFPDWDGDALVAGLSSMSLLRVEINGETGTEVGRYPMGARIRGVEQAPNGTLYLLEDGGQGSPGRLLRISPK